MNEKAKAFEEFLVTEEITSFERREIGDEDGTVVYRSYLSTEIGEMPIFVLLDKTIYNVMRLLVGANVVTDENRSAILEFMNRANSTYKNFKYYIEEDDQSVYLDCINHSTNDKFDPRLLYVLMTQMVEYIDGHIGNIKEVLGVDTLPDPYAKFAHEHEG